MASTNKTTNYQLSQYIGSDKPTYLGDYNSDMSKIDTQMKTNADNIATAIAGVESATSTANSAVSTATQANTTAQTANQTAQSASSTATNAQSTANSALSTATSAQSKANDVETNLNNFEEKFNLTDFTGTLTPTATGGTISENTIKMALNSDKSLFKFYGSLIYTFTQSWSSGSVSFPSSLRPSENYTIESAGICISTTNVNDFKKINLTISTDGTISFNISTGDAKAYRFYFPPCLYFNSNFGD